MARGNLLSRRQIFAATAAAGSAASFSVSDFALADPRPTPPPPVPPTGISTPTAAIVSTAAGKVRGYLENGTFIYKGIPYGASTLGQNRFLPPKPAVPWTGIYNALAYGRICPQASNPQWLMPEFNFLLEFEAGIQGEDCLNLNIWTPDLAASDKRPVMVWFHGGGFSVGSSQELKGYDGANISRLGDVVFVSINHRLNAFGFLDLSAVGGEAYAHSGNAGLLDMILGLEWVRDNIEAFGGDASNVTVMGQSGGGGKVTALMSSPLARGLFHKAVIQSGGSAFGSWSSRENAQLLAARVLKELGINGLPDARLTDLSATVILQALDRASSQLRAEGLNPAIGPVGDDDVLPAPGTGAPEVSRDIPLLIGGNREEMSVSIIDPSVEQLTDEDLRQRLEAEYPGSGQMLYRALRTTSPHERPVELFARAKSWSFLGHIAAHQVRQRNDQVGAAATYRYQFEWRTPVLEGRPRANHNAELAFVFYNTDRSHPAAAGGIQARNLSRKMALSWIAFARSGNPNHADLPVWHPVSPGAWPTMLFNNEVCIRDERINPELLAFENAL